MAPSESTSILVSIESCLFFLPFKFVTQRRLGHDDTDNATRVSSFFTSNSSKEFRSYKPELGTRTLNSTTAFELGRRGDNFLEFLPTQHGKWSKLLSDMTDIVAVVGGKFPPGTPVFNPWEVNSGVLEVINSKETLNWKIAPSNQTVFRKQDSYIK